MWQIVTGRHMEAPRPLPFAPLFPGAGVAGFLQQFCWTYTSIRRTNRLRRRYLEAVLRQEVSFFDTQVCFCSGS